MKIYETGPFQKFVINGEGVSDSRNFNNLERDIRTYLPEFILTRESLIYDLSCRFPGHVLDVIEGGCGLGGLLIDLKNSAIREGIEINTTGVTLDPDHVKRVQNSNIDVMIIGSVQNHFKDGRGRSSYHLVLDYYGAESYDWNPYGGTTLPIYYNLLKKGGIAVLGSSLVLGFQDPQREIATRNQFISKCGFTIIASANGFSILEK